MGIDQIFLWGNKKGGKEERFENWWSGRVHGAVIVSAHVWRRWDARPCAWTALVVTKSQQARQARSDPSAGDGRRTARRVVHDVPFGGASHAHFTCRCSKHSTCQILLENILPHSKWVVYSFEKVFDNFGNTVQIFCQLILQYQLRILSYHINHMLNQLKLEFWFNICNIYYQEY